MKELASCLFVGIGGFFGAVTRYLIARAAAAWLGIGFPYGTLFINLSGAFFLGLIATLVSERFFRAGDQVRLVFAIGFLGAYTTFSTYEFESNALFESGKWQLALTNLFGSLFIGLIAVRLGILAAKQFA